MSEDRKRSVATWPKPPRLSSTLRWRELTKWEELMRSNRAWLLLAALLMNPLVAASANVVTNWDETAVAIIQPRMVPPVSYRAMAIVHIAIFDAVNSIDPAYQFYHTQLPAPPDTSKDA